ALRQSCIHGLSAPGSPLVALADPAGTTKNAVSVILWGPPGTGKTTLAQAIARTSGRRFVELSAVTAGVRDVREVMQDAMTQRDLYGASTILFLDEIHRFTKAQQDALLHSDEDGTLLLIGATTENPSFEVIPALLSRCRVYKLEALTPDELGRILDRALTAEEGLKAQNLRLDPEARAMLITLAGGDARNALTALELAGRLAHPDEAGIRAIDCALVQEAMQRRTLLYDRQGEYHYDVISAFIKSVRGSDPDAALYWLARMLDAGEDPLFIARRLIILASEDISNADPHGLMVASAAFQAVHAVGMPEGRIVLAQAATYLACAPKSNASYLALEAASERVRQGDSVDVPLHLRNAPTKMMKDFGYASGYHYPHDFGGFTDQNYLPEALKGTVFYHPTENGIEKKIKERLLQLWPGRKR
ncbi:MAG TPA: replication-associated recombination protein A, partial [bacterium]|nr:replication-associated recombination protein A [bacterium]